MTEEDWREDSRKRWVECLDKKKWKRKKKKKEKMKKVKRQRNEKEMGKKKQMSSE